MEIPFQLINRRAFEQLGKKAKYCQILNEKC
jgi:hypothetical protein